MRFGYHYMNFSYPGGAEAIGPKLGETAEIAEQIGCSWFSLMDHFFQMEAFKTAHDPMLEGYTALGFVAGRTRTMDLGLLVTGVTYRHPGLLAKIVATLDVISSGRALLGLGAAWYEREHLALGVPFPGLGERFERLEETLQICRQMWSDDDGPYRGTHYQLAETICIPRPVTRPRPPFLIGGGGEKKTLRLVAQYADACNLFGTDIGMVAHKLDVLRGHCDTVGRDFSTITVTVTAGGATLSETDDFLRTAEEYAAIGVHHLQLRPEGDDPAAFLQEFGEKVAPRLAQVETNPIAGAW